VSLKDFFSFKPGGSGNNPDLAFVNLNLLAFSLFGSGVVFAVWWGRISVAMLWACASAAAGFFIGFLFGFPRTIAQPVTQSGAAPAAGSANEPSANPGRASRLSVNTNLEQVSDWITKTIVGVGLVELKKLPGEFVRLAKYASDTIGKPVTGSSAEPAAAALIAYFSVLGFLGGYLITRMFFQPAFDRSDHSADAEAVRTLPVPPPIGDTTVRPPAPTAETKAAADRIKDMPLDETGAQGGVKSSDVAIANLYAGNPEKAIKYYMDAISKDPMNTRLRFEYATALENAKRDDTQVIAALLNARSVESQHPSPELRKRIYESLLYKFLYQPPPQGFTNTIFYGEEYTSDPKNPSSDIVWVNLAAAYGQQARWLHERQEDFNSVRGKALAAARRAVEIDSTNKNFLATLLDPPPHKAADGEDDLAIFREDAEFRTLLGLN